MLLQVNYNEPFSNYLIFICDMLSISPRVCNSRVTSIILVALTHTRGHSHMVYESTICFHFIFLLIFIFILFFIYIYTFVRKVRTKMHHNMHQQTIKQAYYSIIWGLRWDFFLRSPSFSKGSAERSAEWPGVLTHSEVLLRTAASKQTKSLC